MIRRQFLFFAFLTFFMALPIAGCIYRPDVQQGNVITNQDIRGIHKGMSVNQIRFKLGDPILTNIYADGRLVYVYTFQHSHNKMQVRRLIIFFRKDRVSSYWFDSQPPQAPIILPSPKGYKH